MRRSPSAGVAGKIFQAVGSALGPRVQFVEATPGPTNKAESVVPKPTRAHATGTLDESSEIMVQKMGLRGA